jgi:hypothetical protein
MTRADDLPECTVDLAAMIIASTIACAALGRNIEPSAGIRLEQPACSAPQSKVLGLDEAPNCWLRGLHQSLAGIEAKRLGQCRVWQAQSRGRTDREDRPRGLAEGIRPTTQARRPRHAKQHHHDLHALAQKLINGVNLRRARVSTSLAAIRRKHAKRTTRRSKSIRVPDTRAASPDSSSGIPRGDHWLRCSATIAARILTR